GNGSDDGEGGPSRAARKPLATVNHLEVALTLGTGAHHRGVGTCPWHRLRHGEAGTAVAPSERREITVALGRSPGAQQQVHVALVRSGAVESKGTQGTAAGLLEDGAQADRVEAQSAEFRRQLRRPDASAPSFLTQLG